MRHPVHRSWDLAYHVVTRKPWNKKKGLLKTLPLILFTSFSLCASVSSAIFAAWACEEFDDDSALGTKRAYITQGAHGAAFGLS